MASELVHVINVTEAKRRFSELIERVGRGERIIIRPSWHAGHGNRSTE